MDNAAALARAKHAKHAKQPKHARLGSAQRGFTGFKTQSSTRSFSFLQKLGIGAAAVVVACGVCVGAFPLEMDAYGSTAAAEAQMETIPAAPEQDVAATLTDAQYEAFSQVVADGQGLTLEQMAYLADFPQPTTANVQEMLQANILWGGCEIVSLSIALQSMGFVADPVDLADNYLVLDGNFATGYAGSPHASGGGFTPGIAAAANAYLAAQGSDLHAYDLTGSSFQGLRALVDAGMPVLVWSTMGCQEPAFAGIGEAGAEWYSNEHCVVVYGFNGYDVLVSDPMDGLVVRDAAYFQHIYEACGSMALAIW